MDEKRKLENGCNETFFQISHKKLKLNNFFLQKDKF
jgi:hypothetical protein